MMAVDIDRLSHPERLLWGHGVRKPEHIDLEAIACARGAHVVYRKLDGCAARLVAAGDCAVISVAMDDNLGRRRFSLGHELAHLMQDAKRTSFKCSSTDIGPQNAEAKSIEADANSFASQLILPDYLVLPWVADSKPSLDLANAMASDFQASLTASALKLLQRAKVPSAITCHDQRKLKWYRRKSGFFNRLLHPERVAPGNNRIRNGFRSCQGTQPSEAGECIAVDQRAGSLSDGSLVTVDQTS